VGDREYYNDVWMLDINGCTWIQLELSGPEPQGRFSHTAVLAEGVIAIYGGYMGKPILSVGKASRPLISSLVTREFVIVQVWRGRASTG
jgi:hypothetical protein